MATDETETEAQPYLARRVDKPWGYELIWAETSRYVGKILHIEAGHQLSLQYHRVKDETVAVLSGVLDLEIGKGERPRRTLRLQEGQSVRIRPGIRHRMLAVVTCDILEASTPELDDIVRLEDLYGRAG